MPTDKTNRTICLKCLPKLEYVPAGGKEDDDIDIETVSSLSASVPDISYRPASVCIPYTSSSSSSARGLFLYSNVIFIKGSVHCANINAR